MLREISAINFLDEIEVIKQAGRESKQSLTFESKVATHANFVEIINKAPRILHIACHGLHHENRNQKHEFAIKEVNDFQSFLLFENDMG